jgi:hypothetical protein
MNLCVCDANLRKEKSSVHSGQQLSGSDQKKKEKKLFVLNIGKKRTLKTIECVD